MNAFRVALPQAPNAGHRVFTRTSMARRHCRKSCRLKGEVGSQDGCEEELSTVRSWVKEGRACVGYSAEVEEALLGSKISMSTGEVSRRCRGGGVSSLSVHEDGK
jgi:hypothetical protein